MTLAEAKKSRPLRGRHYEGEPVQVHSKSSTLKCPDPANLRALEKQLRLLSAQESDLRCAAQLADQAIDYQRRRFAHIEHCPRCLAAEMVSV